MEGKYRYIQWGYGKLIVWCRDFEARCHSWCQPVLLVSGDTGSHAFFNHQQTPEGSDVTPFYICSQMSVWCPTKQPKMTDILFYVIQMQCSCNCKLMFIVLYTVHIPYPVLRKDFGNILPGESQQQQLQSHLKTWWAWVTQQIQRIEYKLQHIISQLSSFKSWVMTRLNDAAIIDITSLAMWL